MVIYTVDTSSLVAFFADAPGRDVELLEAVLQESALYLLPPVISEILSDPKNSQIAVKPLNT